MTHIEGNFYLDADEYQYILKEYRGKNKKDEDTYKIHGYFRHPHETLEALVGLGVREDIRNGSSLKEISDRMLSLSKYFRSKFEEE